MGRQRERSQSTGDSHSFRATFLGGADGLFTTAYFHLPRDLRAEVTEAGFSTVQILNVEGPGFLMTDFERRWADPVQRETILWAAEVVESEPEMLAASSHIVAVAQSPTVTPL